MNNGINGKPFLEGQLNFRGLEGIKSKDGRCFRKNLVYRSGSLHGLNESDVRKLESIGLAMVIDFRSDREIKSHPSCSISTVKETLRIAIHDAARDLAMSFLEKNDAPGLEKLLVSDYRRIIRDDSPGFREFFRIMKQATEFPLEPKTAFYDWLYIGVVFPHREFLRRLEQYAGFTDIEFNPSRSINCQARSCAIFVAMMKKGILERVIQTPADFVAAVAADSSEQPHSLQDRQRNLF